MKIKYLVISILLLFGLNVFLLLQIKNLINTNISIRNYYTYKAANDSLKYLQLKQLVNGNYFIPKDLPKSVKECVKNGPKLFLFISEGNCSACIEEILFDLYDLENIVKDNLIILGNFNTKKSFDDYISNAFIYNNNNSIYCRDLNIPEIFKQQPLLFVVDEKYNLLLFFVPDFYPEYKKEYFTNILPNYFRFNGLNN